MNLNKSTQACVHACVISQLYNRRKEKHSRQQNKTNRTHKGKKCTYIYKEAEKKPLLEPGNKGSWDNGGEADKSRRPQETGRITMPAECADQLGNTAKNAERHRSAESIIMITAPLDFTQLSQPAHCVSETKATCL